jgi:hypothetical protein
MTSRSYGAEFCETDWARTWILTESTWNKHEISRCLDD